jgi:predicted transcriptional regulator
MNNYVIGSWLTKERQKVGVTRTAVAVAMGWPGGAVKALEENNRTPEASTVQKYLLALKGIDINVGRSVPNNMYERFHS